MTRMVQVTVAADMAEAEEIQAMLATAGIHSELELAVEDHPTGLEDAPHRVLVPEAELEAAEEAIEELSEPDEFLGDE